MLWKPKQISDYGPITVADYGDDHSGDNNRNSARQMPNGFSARRNASSRSAPLSTLTAQPSTPPVMLNSFQHPSG
jgi:hypothetical protein